jgi:hypothetical protein
MYGVSEVAANPTKIALPRLGVMSAVRGAQSQRFVRIERATDNVLPCEVETQ